MFTQLSKHHGTNEIVSNERTAHQKELKIKYAKRTSLATIALFLMSLAHHVYGETAIFGGALRYYMSAVAILPVVISIASYFLYKKKEKPLYFWLLTGSGILLFFVIGLFEGFYAHTLLDILTLLGISSSTLSQYYIRAEFKTLMFEITGVAQFLPIALLLGYYLKKLVDETQGWASQFIRKQSLVIIGWLSMLSLLAARYVAVVTEWSINGNKALLDVDIWTFRIGIPLAFAVLILCCLSRNQSVRKIVFSITTLYTLYFVVSQFGLIGEGSNLKLLFVDLMQYVVGIWTILQVWQLMNENQE